MKISELPPGLKELAEKRQLDCADDWYSKIIDRLSRAFEWGATPEGFEFWNFVDEGNFTPFYNCKVVKFKLKEK